MYGKAVSYTHLDVYKRQVLRSTKRVCVRVCMFVRIYSQLYGAAQLFLHN